MMVTGKWRASQAASQLGHNSVSITQSARLEGVEKGGNGPG